MNNLELDKEETEKVIVELLRLVGDRGQYPLDIKNISWIDEQVDGREE